jgi:F-type H+-transporting ATPase subunit a
MRKNYFPSICVALAVFLAVLATSTGFEPYEEHPHNPFDHIADATDIWHISDAYHISLPLPVIGQRLVISKFMILEVMAAILVAVIFVPLAKRAAGGEPPRGAWDNAFESVLTFVRNEIAKRNIGEHDADRFVPFLWTLFLFILFNNLLGMLPWMGSPTANLYVTGALGLICFVVMHGAAMVKMGVGHYFQSLWPHIDVPFGMGYILKPMIFMIEFLGTVIKSGVLAVRLFANMFAGHTVLAMILGFIVVAGNAAPLLWTGITVASVFGVFALSLLELFVAFLQSYIFVFLASLFIGMSLHPAH